MGKLKGIVKGDTINLEGDLNIDITDWKIRCQVYDDCGQCIKLATLNTGGTDDQIEVTDATNGIFIIKVIKGATKNFADKGFIEIEVENPSEEVHTVLKDEIAFVSQEIDWETP